MAAVTAGKAAAAASRRFGKGGGTALPGLLAERIEPRVVEKLGQQLDTRVLVTGTNGKTTTTRILSSILAAAGIPCLHNREGSNLMRGFASMLVTAARPGGRLAAAVGGAGAIGLFETDEATMPAATRSLAPRVIAVTNLFRDQLDRYGEVDTVFALWKEALVCAPPDCTLVLNADDPSVADLATDWPGGIHWFGIEDAAFASEATGAFDARWCRACGGTFAYTRRYFAHIGFWRCEGCGRARPAPDTTAAEIKLAFDSATFTLARSLSNVSTIDNRPSTIGLPLTGLYNVYNALAAIAVARVLGVEEQALAGGLAAVHPAFGRQETITLHGRRLRIMLVKNPAGANQVIALLSQLAGGDGKLMIAALLNDRFADGRDVSWTWDVDYERLSGKVVRCWAGGDRAEDMALRLKYAAWPLASCSRTAAELLDAIVGGSQTGDDIIVIPTYTAMLDLRAELARRGAAANFWEPA